MSSVTSKILITGSNGLLGQKLIQYCLHHSIDFLATSAGKNRVSFCPEEQYETLDITDSLAVENIVKTYCPTHIINAAAMTNVDACEDEVERCYAINRRGVENFIKVIEGTEIHFLQISTDFIFDGKKRIYTEEDVANPLGEYGKSKWEGEKVLFSSNSIQYTILRTSLLYGVGEKLQKGNIFKWAMSKLREGEQINIVDDQFRTPTYAEDLAKSCFQVIQKKKMGIYNIGGAELNSMYEFILQVAHFVEADRNLVQPITSAVLNQKAPRPQSSGLDITKAQKDFSYQPTPFLETLSILIKDL